MAGSFALEIITPEQVVFRGEVESLVAPAAEGYLGVLPRHAPLLAGLAVGEARVKSGGEERSFAVAGGFLEVRREGVTLLPDTAEPAGRIDAARAEAARARAERRLAERAADTNIARAEAALRKAINRLRVAAGGRG